ncbi:MAG: hypothetical protein RLZZ450_6574 [Pseudomonadota bacterium]|jgi:hypothetical protein
MKTLKMQIQCGTKAAQIANVLLLLVGACAPFDDELDDHTGPSELYSESDDSGGDPTARGLSQNKSAQAPIGTDDVADPAAAALPAATDEANGALQQLNTCVEVRPGAVSRTARQKHLQTECSPDLARSRAIAHARRNARSVLEETCQSQVSHAEAVAACAAQGLHLSAYDRLGGWGIYANGSPSDSALGVGTTAEARLCVVLDDLTDESQSATQGDALCVLDGFRRTLFTAYARARCGVQCEPS